MSTVNACDPTRDPDDVLRDVAVQARRNGKRNIDFTKHTGLFSIVSQLCYAVAQAEFRSAGCFV